MDLLRNKQKQKLIDLFHDSKWLDPDEILEQTNLRYSSNNDKFLLREVLMFHEQQEEQPIFVEENGILIPALSQEFHEWPISCSQERLEITVHAFCVNRPYQYWGRLAPQQEQYLCYFENIKESHLPYTVVNVIPDMDIGEELYTRLEEEIQSLLPVEMLYVPSIVREGLPILEYTIKLNGMAYSCLDYGLTHPLTRKLSDFFSQVKNYRIEQLLSMGLDTLRKMRPIDLSKYLVPTMPDPSP